MNPHIFLLCLIPLVFASLDKIARKVEMKEFDKTYTLNVNYRFIRSKMDFLKLAHIFKREILLVTESDDFYLIWSNNISLFIFIF